MGKSMVWTPAVWTPAGLTPAVYSEYPGGMLGVYSKYTRGILRVG